MVYFKGKIGCQEGQLAEDNNGEKYVNSTNKGCMSILPQYICLLHDQDNLSDRLYSTQNAILKAKKFTTTLRLSCSFSI